MKKFMFFVGSALLRRWLASPSQPSFAGASIGTSKLNIPYISTLARRYFFLAGTGLVFTLFFTSGIVMAIFSAAQSYDLFGLFVPGVVFYTGLGMALVSAVVMSICYRKAVGTKFEAQQLYVYEAPPPEAYERRSPATPMDYVTSMAQPFFSGLAAGWKKDRKPRASKPDFSRQAQEQNKNENMDANTGINANASASAYREGRAS